MSVDNNAVKSAIREKLIAIASSLDADASGISDEDIIPATGLVDSAGILELVVWFEKTYELTLSQEEINIDNLGSINAMAAFLATKKSAA